MSAMNTQLVAVFMDYSARSALALCKGRVVSDLQLQSLNQCIYVLPDNFTILLSYHEGLFISGHVMGNVVGGYGRKICGSLGRLQLDQDLQEVLTLLHDLHIPG